MHPTEALATLLLTRGVAAQQIPASLAARELLWRDRIADKKVLLVLDDATGPGQVESLLPGGSGSLVLITSRHRLGGLDDVVSISLDILTPGEAAELFCRIAARPDLAPTDAAVAEVSRLCGYLPLAIRLMAGRLHHPKIGHRRPGRRPGRGAGPAEHDGRRGALGHRRVRPVLPGPERRSAAGVPSAGVTPRAGDRRLRHRRSDRHHRACCPWTPGGSLRSAPTRRTRTGPLPLP